MGQLFLRVLLLFVLCGALPLHAAQTILVLGDSLSAGYGISLERGWVSLLQQRLAQRDKPYRVVNASISGETTSGGLYRIDALLAKHQPRIVLLELGANDGLRGLPVDTPRANLGDMIRHARTSGAKVLLIGMRLPPNYGPAYTEQFHRLYAELAQRYHVGHVPFLLEGFAGKPEWFQADGLHPIEAAQPMMLDNVWRALLPMLAGH